MLQSRGYQPSHLMQKKNIFYAINDSRNNNKEGDASLYTLKIQVSSRGIEQVNFLNQRPLLDAKQQPFVTNTVDAEGLALTHMVSHYSGVRS